MNGSKALTHEQATKRLPILKSSRGTTIFTGTRIQQVAMIQMDASCLYSDMRL